MNNKLTIYCCYHKEDESLNKNDGCVWFFGPNDPLNPYLSEFSMFYWIWKNDKDSDYIGTSHYSRKIFPYQFLQEYVNNDSCQIYERLASIHGKEDYWGIFQWSRNEWWQCEWLYDDFVDYITKKYGENNIYLQTDKRIQNEKYFINRSTFILTREHFMNMCDFLFGMLDYIDTKYELNKDPQKYQAWIINNYFEKTNKNLPFNIQNNMNDVNRLLAFFFEWLASLYIQANISNTYFVQ